MKNFFQSINFSNINVNKATNVAVLGIAALSAMAGATDQAILGIIIFLTSTVIMGDSKWFLMELH